MSQRNKIILAALSIIWIIFIVWGIMKTHQTRPDQGLPFFTPPAERPETFKGTRGPRDEGTTDGRVTSPDEDTLQPPLLVRVFKPSRTDFADSLSVMGTVKAKAEYPLRFEVQGVIEKINFQEGDFIKKGDLIANLEPTDAKLKLTFLGNKVASVQKNYESLLKTLELYQQLYEADALLKTKLEEVELKVEASQAELSAVKVEKELAEEELKKCYLYAATDGVMGQKEAEAGEFITPQNELGTFFDTAELFVEVGIVERDSNKVSPGQRAEIYIDAFPGAVFQGAIERIYPVVEGKSRTLTGKIKLLKPQQNILPGMFSRVDIVTVELTDTLMVPTISLITLDQGLFMLPVIPSYTLREEEEGTQTGTVELRTVDVGYMSSDYVQILNNLDEGELVVTEVQGEIKDKAKVRVTGTEEFGY